MLVKLYLVLACFLFAAPAMAGDLVLTAKWVVITALDIDHRHPR